MFHEIHQSLTAAMATGKIGEQVSVRVHLQLPPANADLNAALDSIIAMTDPAVSQPMTKLQSRVHADGNQWNVLLQSANGRTLFVTLGRGSVQEATLELLVVGNHGVIRLEGGRVVFTAVGDNAVPTAKSITAWTELVKQSHENGAAVPLER